MGGKPWTSGGCRTCKKRKLKCDEQKPQCARCIKRGIECLGYVDRRIFVHHASTQPEKIQNDTQKSTHSLQYSRRAREFILPATPSVSPAMRVQLSSSFLNTYFPYHMEKIAGSDSWYFLFNSWVTLPNKNELFDRALSALSCICLGRTNQDRGLYHHGLLQYNKAIRLQSNMINCGLCTEEMLYSALVFLEIESFSCPEGMEAWYTHAIGAYALIKRYRSTAETSESPAMDCLLNRFAKLLMILIISSLNVSGDEYKKIVQSCGETPFDGLVKLYADSAIIAQAASSISPLDYRACQLLLHHSVAHENNIVAWYEQIRGEIGGPPWECAKGESLCSGIARADDLFGTPYRFTSLENARIHILVWNLLRDLQPYIFKARSLVNSFTHESLPKYQISRENQQLASYYADQMARSVLYCVQDDFKSCGVQCLIFCLCQTAKTWIDVKRADKIAWCQEIFDFVAGLGFDYANRLKEAMVSQWVQAGETKPDELSPIKELAVRVGEARDVAGVSQLAALPGMLGKPSMLDVPELSSMSPTAKLPDARFAVTVPVRERGSIQ